MKVNEYFDHVYCLNLDRRQDRWNKISKKFNELGIQVQRFSAIDGNNLSDDILSKYSINKYEVGCFLSHYEIIKDAKKNDYKRILVFEDDALFVNNFNKKFENIPNKVKKDWKLIYLGATQGDNWDMLDFNGGFYCPCRTDGLFAYATNNSVYDEILKFESTTNKPIDTVLHDIQEKYYGSCYVFFPYLAIADMSDSDIRKIEHQSIPERFIKLRWDQDKYDEMMMGQPPQTNLKPNTNNVFCNFCGHTKDKIRYNFCQKCGKLY